MVTWVVSDFLVAYQLSRGRFEAEVKDLNQAQLNWKIYPSALSIGQMAMHLAGVEIYFTYQLLGLKTGEFEQRLISSATDGVVNDMSFPFSPGDLTPELVDRGLRAGREFALQLLESTDPSVRLKEVKTVLGPMASGEGAMARITCHPFYHQGQAYQIKNSPGFPA